MGLDWTKLEMNAARAVAMETEKDQDVEIGPQCGRQPLHRYKVKVQHGKKHGKKQIIFPVRARSMSRGIKAGELRAVRYLDSYKKDLARDEAGSIRTTRKPDPSPFQMIVEEDTSL